MLPLTIKVHRISLNELVLSCSELPGLEIRGCSISAVLIAFVEQTGETLERLTEISRR